MALLYWDGLDSYNNLSDFNGARPQNVSSFAGGFGGWDPSFQTSSGRYGGRAIWNGGYSQWGKIQLSTYQELWTGRALYFAGNGGLVSFWGTDSGTTSEVYVDVSSGTVRAFGNGILLGQSSFTFSYSAWHFVEVRAKISSSNSTNDGQIEVWVDNVRVIANNACITKTVNASTGYYGVNLFGQGSIGTDDIYVLDTTGPAPWNTRLGDCRMASVAVNLDSGPNQGTPSTGSAHYAVVDEIPYTLSDYISLSSTASGQGEMFGHANFPGPLPNTVFATAVVAVAGKTDAGNANFTLSVRTGPQGANTYNSISFGLSTSNAFYRQEWSANPNTNAQWTVTEWQTANVGFYIV